MTEEYDGYDGPRGLDISQDARTMAMLSHLLGLLVGFLGPLIIWLIKRETEPFVDHQGKESLNFTLFTLILYTVLFIIGSFLCFPLLAIPVVMIMHIIWAIQGCIAANKGEVFRYPMNWRMIR